MRLLADIARATWLCVIAWTATTLSPDARAADPTLPIIVTAGSSGAPHPMPGVDPQGQSLSSVALPEAPVVRWRVRLSDAPVGPALVDASGHIFIATRRGVVRQLDRAGKTLWEATTGEDIAAAPVLMNGGDRVVLTASTHLMSWHPSGRGNVKRRLSSTSPLSAPPLPLPDETLLVAIGNDVLQLDREGRTVAAFSLSEQPYALLSGSRRVIVVGRAGGIFQWTDPDPPQEVGVLGGRPTGHALLDDGGRLMVIVEGNRLVEFDLDSRLRRIALEAPLLAPLARIENGVLSISADGNLLAVASNGKTVVRGTVFRSAASRQPPQVGFAALVVDPSGRGVLTDPQRGVATLSRAGRVTWLSPAPCKGAAHAAPQAPGAIVVTCRDGTVALLASGQATQPPEMNK